MSLRAEQLINNSKHILSPNHQNKTETRQGASPQPPKQQQDTRSQESRGTPQAEPEWGRTEEVKQVEQTEERQEPEGRQADTTLTEHDRREVCSLVLMVLEQSGVWPWINYNNWHECIFAITRMVSSLVFEMSCYAIKGGNDSSFVFVSAPLLFSTSGEGCLVRSWDRVVCSQGWFFPRWVLKTALRSRHASVRSVYASTNPRMRNVPHLQII